MSCFKVFCILVALLLAMLGSIIAYLYGSAYAGFTEQRLAWALGPLILGSLLFIGCFGLVLSLITIGLISSVNRGKAFPLGALPIAVVVPIAVCFLLGYVIQSQILEIERKSIKAKQERLEGYLQQVKEDPEIVFREEWYKIHEKRSVFQDTLFDESVPYTDEQLQRVVDQDLVYGSSFFRQERLSSSFLIRYYHQYYGDEDKDFTLLDILRHRNLPLHLVRRLIEDPDYPQSYTVRRAKRIYENRKAERISR